MIASTLAPVAATVASLTASIEILAKTLIQGADVAAAGSRPSPQTQQSSYLLPADTVRCVSPPAPHTTVAVGSDVAWVSLPAPRPRVEHLFEIVAELESESRALVTRLADFERAELRQSIQTLHSKYLTLAEIGRPILVVESAPRVLPDVAPCVSLLSELESAERSATELCAAIELRDILGSPPAVFRPPESTRTAAPASRSSATQSPPATKSSTASRLVQAVPRVADGVAQAKTLPGKPQGTQTPRTGCPETVAFSDQCHRVDPHTQPVLVVAARFRDSLKAMPLDAWWCVTALEAAQQRAGTFGYDEFDEADLLHLQLYCLRALCVHGLGLSSVLCRNYVGGHCQRYNYDNSVDNWIQGIKDARGIEDDVEENDYDEDDLASDPYVTEKALDCGDGDMADEVPKRRMETTTSFFSLVSSEYVRPVGPPRPGVDCDVKANVAKNYFASASSASAFPA